jgi:hypothetical protein
MILLASALAFALLVCGYLYFNNLSLDRQLHQYRKEVLLLTRSYQHLLANAEQAPEALQLVFQQQLSQCKNHAQKQDKTLKVITPLISHFSLLTKRYFQDKALMHDLIKQHYNQNGQGSFNALVNLINEQDQQIRSAWQQNNINGLIIVIASLLKQADAQHIDEEAELAS